MKPKPKTESTLKGRTLTHHLVYDKRAARWSCKCGYELGNGHHALYAVCPLSHRDKAVNERKRKADARPKGKGSYREFTITSKPSEKAQKLFDL